MMTIYWFSLFINIEKYFTLKKILKIILETIKLDDYMLPCNN